jgi:hypothetical protein
MADGSAKERDVCEKMRTGGDVPKTFFTPPTIRSITLLRERLLCKLSVLSDELVTRRR